jgi:hypothetical protein
VPGGWRKTTWDSMNRHRQMTATANGMVRGEDIVENKNVENDMLIFYVVVRNNCFVNKLVVM